MATWAELEADAPGVSTTTGAQEQPRFELDLERVLLVPDERWPARELR